MPQVDGDRDPVLRAEPRARARDHRIPEHARRSLEIVKAPGEGCGPDELVRNADGLAATRSRPPPGDLPPRGAHVVERHRSLERRVRGEPAHRVGIERDARGDRARAVGAQRDVDPRVDLAPRKQHDRDHETGPNASNRRE